MFASHESQRGYEKVKYKLLLLVVLMIGTLPNNYNSCTRFSALS